MRITLNKKSASCCSGSSMFCLAVLFFAVAVCSASAQTMRPWTNSTNTQFNSTTTWNPSGMWANGDTLRLHGMAGGNFNPHTRVGRLNSLLLNFTTTRRSYPVSWRDRAELWQDRGSSFLGVV